MHTVLFLCEGNSLRSPMAEAFFNARPPPRWKAISRGIRPLHHISLTTILIMQEKGLDLSRFTPKPLTPEDIAKASRIISLTGLVPQEQRIEHWDIPNKDGDDIQGCREVRDMVEERVKQLVQEIARS